MKRALDDEQQATGTKQHKSASLWQQIFCEVDTARRERRDFSFSKEAKMEMVEQYGLDTVCNTLLRAIRETNTPLADPLHLEDDLTSGIKAVRKASANLTKTQPAWGYQEGDKTIVYQAGETILLSDKSAVSKALSTRLSGYERYHAKVNTGPTGADNWANDNVLLSRIRNNMTNAENIKKEALSRNRVRAGLLQTHGCHYPTAFPISVVLWVLQREAARRPNGRLVRYIDPCAGWGDRLTGALLAGSGVVENYLGIDPWTVSNDVCRRIHEKLGSLEPPPLVQVEIRSEMAQKGGWPDADLVFTGPPYAALERYNCEGGSTDDGQAWRLAADGKFGTEFLLPLLHNAAEATRALRGRVIINMANTKKKDGGEFLTRDVVYLAGLAGLVHVETFGMKLSDRLTSKNHGSDVKRGEPFFVFEHPE